MASAGNGQPCAGSQQFPQRLRPPQLQIPQPSLHQGNPLTPSSTIVQTPVHRRLFAGHDASCLVQEESVSSRACVEQWLDLMELSTRRNSITSCSDSSSTTGAPWECSMSSSAPSSCPALGHAGLDVSCLVKGPPLTSRAEDLPPPAFVVLRVLSQL